MRINKYIAKSTGCSRRQADELILAGKVRVNNKVCEDLSTLVFEHDDKIELDGQDIKLDIPLLYIMMNKPKGLVVTRSDEWDRKTVYSILPQEFAFVKPVGRLDKDSEGLLLLTNDGEMINKILHPKYKLEKVYQVIVAGKVNKGQLTKLREGIDIGDGITQPAGVYIRRNDERKTTLKFVLKEGRKRQIRRMLESVEAKVISLKRTQIGEIQLGRLPLGQWRYLTRQEIMFLKKDK
ncbi:rRNA pseudouridine synthase [bacterium]|nr:rRNA pseudouridine synthase [bacterium]